MLDQHLHFGRRLGIPWKVERFAGGALSFGSCRSNLTGRDAGNLALLEQSGRCGPIR